MFLAFRLCMLILWEITVKKAGAALRFEVRKFSFLNIGSM